MTSPDFVILYVDKLERSGAFYSALLGRKPVESSPTFVLFVLHNGFKLGLWSRHTVEPAAAALGGGAELVFALDSPEAVDDTHTDWTERGLKILQAPTDMDFGRTFVALDPDNHRLRVYWPNDGEQANGARKMSAHWIAVASAEHVRRGREGGFMQVSHGKMAPLRRIKPCDGIVYYSPTTILGEKDGLQSFTAIGTVREGEPYQGDMGGGFMPFRRDVEWAKAREAPIKPLLDRLEFTAGKANWGYQLRIGLLPVSAHDFSLIAQAMGVKATNTA